MWILGITTLAILIGGGGFIGFQTLNKVRVEGDGFKVNVSRRVSELAGRRVSFSRFREAEKYSVGTASMAVTPEFNDLLGSAEFTDLMLKMTPASWMSDDWTLPEVRMRNVNLTFQPLKVMDTGTMLQTNPVPVDRGAVGKGGFRMGVTSDPASISVESGQFESLNLSWPGPEGKPESLSKMEGYFRPMDGAVNLEIRGGILDTAAWPPFKVEQINARVKGTALEILSARVAISDTSIARLSGKAELVPDGKLELTADIQPVLLKDLLPDFWNSRIAGQFVSEGAKWVSQFKSGPPAEFSGPFTGRGIVFQNLGFVDKIANFLRKPELTLMEFSEFRGNFSWTAKRVRISEIAAQTQDNLLKLSGWVEVVPGESVAAQLRVEASEAFFAGLSGPPPFFKPSGDGFLAMDFELSGRGNVVQDNIPVPVPVMMERGPEAGPRMSLPQGANVPAPSFAPQSPQTPRTVTPVPAGPSGKPPTSINAPSITPSDELAPPPVPREKSAAELEADFNRLIGR